jgi:outer membrane lipoprotein LolB
VNRRRLACAALLVLAACSTVPPRPDIPVARDAEALAALDHWQASGRIAVRAGEEGFSARFDWRQAGSAGALGVRGPFGAGAARVSIEPERIRIEAGSEPPLDVPAPFEALEPLLRARLGFPLPLASLRYWLLGIPAPGDAVAVDALGAFEQVGWRVLAREFVLVERAPGPLPSRLELTRGTTRIRVLVERWQADAP